MQLLSPRPQASLVKREQVAGWAGAGREGREPLVLPLLHVLHLQAEGGEAGQEVCHLIHLRDKSEALSRGVRTSLGAWVPGSPSQ